MNRKRANGHTMHSPPGVLPPKASPAPPLLFTPPRIQPFAPPEVQMMKLMEEQNNLYACIITQMQQEAVNLRALETIKVEVTSGKVSINHISIPYGIKDHRRHLVSKDLPEYLKGLDEASTMVKTRLKGIEGQLQHRADELGGERFKILSMLYSMMILQHGQDPRELADRLLSNYLENQMIKRDPDEPFKQVQGRAMQRDMTALLATAQAGLQEAP